MAKMPEHTIHFSIRAHLLPYKPVASRDSADLEQKSQGIWRATGRIEHKTRGLPRVRDHRSSIISYIANISVEAEYYENIASSSHTRLN